MTAGYIDAHCHLTDASFASSLNADLRIWREQGVAAYVLGGVDADEWERQDELCRAHPGAIFPVWGLHPWTVAALAEEACMRQLALLHNRLANARPVAVGETGLDHARAKSRAARERQARYFTAQLRLAREADLPVVVHIVQAHDAALERLDQAEFRDLRVMAHGFRGDRSLVLRYARQGLTLSLGPNAAARMDDEALRSVPPELLVVESDAPFGAMHSNVTPASLFDTAARLAQARGESAAQVLERSRTNLERLFDLKRARP